MLFEDDVVKGHLSGDSALLYAYGIYLMHGGKPEDFQEFTMDEVQILITAYTGTVARVMNDLFKMQKALRGIQDD